MGIFGTSSDEEAQLRAAVNASKKKPSVSRPQLSVSEYTTDGAQSFYTAASAVMADEESMIEVLKLHPSLTEVACDTTADSQHGSASNPTQDTTQQDVIVDDSQTQEIPILDLQESPDMSQDKTLNNFNSFQDQQSPNLNAICHTLTEKGLPYFNTSGSELPQEPVHAKDLDWDGPNDPDNPQNWSKAKKWFITVTTAVVCLCCSLGLSLFVTGTPYMMQRFHVSQELCLSGLTFYLVGLAFGPVILAPLSEVVGRRWIYSVSLPLLLLFTVGVGLAKNMHTILVLRFFVGYAALPALSIAGGTIADLWANDPIDMSLATTIFCLAPFLGPVIGPIIGGYAAQHKGWEWSAAWILMMFSGAILPFVLACPETYKPIVLRRRAAARGIHLIKEPFTKAKCKALANYVLLLPIQMLVTDPIVLVMSVYISFIFAVLFGFFEAYPIIFRGVYHMSLGNLGLPFIGVGLGLCFGVVFYAMLDRYHFFKKDENGLRLRFDAEGKMIWDPPERKLLAGKIGAVCLPISLFWMGWTARHSVHWMAPTAAGFPFGFGLILVFFSVVVYFGMSFPPMFVALALAANNFLRYTIASVFPLFTVQMYNRLGIDWASSLFAFIALAMVPVPFVYERYGPKFRANSKYGYAAYAKRLKEEAAEKQTRETEQQIRETEQPIKEQVSVSTTVNSDNVRQMV